MIHPRSAVVLAREGRLPEEGLLLDLLRSRGVRVRMAREPEAVWPLREPGALLFVDLLSTLDDPTRVDGYTGSCTATTPSRSASRPSWWCSFPRRSSGRTG